MRGQLGFSGEPGFKRAPPYQGALVGVAAVVQQRVEALAACCCGGTRGDRVGETGEWAEVKVCLFCWQNSKNGRIQSQLSPNALLPVHSLLFVKSIPTMRLQSFSPRAFSACATTSQGLTLLHSSLHLEHFWWDGDELVDLTK